MAAGYVQQQLRNEERRNLIDALCKEPFVLGLKLVEPANARSDRHAAAVGVFLWEFDARIGHGIDGSGDRELCISIKATDFLRVRDVFLLRVPGHLPAELDAEPGYSEQRDWADAALSTDEPVPEHLDRSAKRGHNTQPRHDRPPLHAPTCHALFARFSWQPVDRSRTMRAPLRV